MKKKDLKHVAIILDGNGGWAQQRDLPRIRGHYEGGRGVKEISIYASQHNIERMSVFAFSTENWKRPEEEISFIFKLPKIFFEMYLADLMKHQIKITYIGDLDKVPDYGKRGVLDAIEKTKNNKGMTLCFALNYGSYDEIVKATKKIAYEVKEKGLAYEVIDKELFENYLMDATPVDLLIRTSGEQRISNFLLWQIAYSEIYFSKVLWPDFSIEEFQKTIDEYNQRDRRFGGITNV